MKKYKGLIIFTSILIFLCFASTAMFTTNSFFHFFELSSSKAQNIGGAIGGITAPIIGLFTSILLYLALIKQIESNKEQQLKNESDLIFSLFSQLDNEIDGFYYKYKIGKEEHEFKGIEALHEFSRMFRYEYSGVHSEQPGPFSKEIYQSQYLELLIDTYNLILKRIQISLLSEEMKSLFRNKGTSYYRAKFNIAFNNFYHTFNDNPYLKDNLTDKFQKFVEANSPVFLST